MGAATSKSDIRINHIQVLGTHNSYHREINLKERAVFEKYIPSPENYYYSHPTLTNQLSHQPVRSLELDLHSDEKGGKYAHPLLWKLANFTNPNYTDPDMYKPGLKIFHVTDADQGSVCHTFIGCLKELSKWSKANPRHVPIMIDLELKTDAVFAVIGGVQSAENWTLPRLLNVDSEIRSVLKPSQLITPDNVRKNGLTLQDSVLKYGWPRLEDSRGKFFFYMDNDPNNADPTNPRNIYRSNGSDSLQGRVLFTNAIEGDADAAFIKYNDPQGNNTADIQRLVKKGYILRTRADEPITTVLSGNFTRRALALKSGAHIVTTDFQSIGMSSRWAVDYVAELPGGVLARCNPISAPKGCKDALLE